VADPDLPINVTELRPKADPTNADRQRRHRAKRRKRRTTVTPRAAATVTPSVTPTVTVSAAPNAEHVPHLPVTVTAATLVAALALATCSAAFSINGLTAIFAGDSGP
jgi:hypothetical protein